MLNQLSQIGTPTQKYFNALAGQMALCQRTLPQTEHIDIFKKNKTKLNWSQEGIQVNHSCKSMFHKFIKRCFPKGNHSVITFLGIFCSSIPLCLRPVEQVQGYLSWSGGMCSPEPRINFRRSGCSLMEWIISSVCWAKTRPSRLNLGKIEGRSCHMCLPFSLNYKWQLLSYLHWIRILHLKHHSR